MTRKEAIAEQERLFPGSRKYGPRPMLPEICLAARMSLNGAADPWELDFLRDVQAMLKARMATWDWTKHAWSKHAWTNHPSSLEYAFDAAVYTMVGATVEMLAEYLKGERIGGHYQDLSGR